MSKGKTNQPLTIVVSPRLMDTPEVQALVAQGHNIVHWSEHENADGFVGERAWRMTPELIKYLPMALKAMRKEKRESSADRKAGKPEKETRTPRKSTGRRRAKGSAGSVPKGSGVAETHDDGATEPRSN